MDYSRRFIFLFVITGFVARAQGAGPDTPAPAWREWTPAAFAEAKRDRRPVLLDLEAKWCHWCHVMDERTYAEPRVAKLLREKFITVRVDQDSRPDLANRYEDYGWPATVVFSPDGRELAKRRGFIRPDDMLALLNDSLAGKISGEVVPAEPVVSGTTALTPARRAVLREQWLHGYDDKAGGWGFSHKFLDADTVEYALREAAGGDGVAGRRARETLRLQRRIHDPVWGGVYQYSAGGGWDEPHFEKLMLVQADNVRSYARACAVTGDRAYLADAFATHRYVRRFLTSPDGVVYVSQDADLTPGEHAADYFALDDKARLARGVPRVDTHIYSRENGAYILALVTLAEVSGDKSYGDEALRAARWILDKRALPDGGFRHGDSDKAGPYLADTLAMGRAFLALHEWTGDAAWLTRAEAAGVFIEANFRVSSDSGYATSVAGPDAFPPPLPHYDENVNLVRFATALSSVTGRAEFRATAERAMRFVLAPANTDTRGFYVGGALLAAREFSTEPTHVTIVGSRIDPVARRLFDAALTCPDAHRLIEWWDPASGPAPRGDNVYPVLDKPAAFLCANNACSAPIDSPVKLRERLRAPAR